ncbi:piggyBac transposable element-derived protein 4 [Biomphalaria pfeifferi]|uniref:PiggyBac transposable element-derived protein 4 n=1 Tax=Biomphalaria pfeifferi TaxID=112525 RepID=A0AAD8B9N0_BIOPF|nr:piggyBac transposable element-derived protein 4 [Biomphalaria pfeifferi]
MFAFSGVLTLLSYCPPKPKKKIVMLLSTMHRRGDTTETVRLPDMVQFYNETKNVVLIRLINYAIATLYPDVRGVGH